MAGNKLKIDIRRNKILEQLRADGKVSVAKLSAELGATQVTIRNDLDSLERDGYLVRIQGGAVCVPKNEHEDALVKVSEITNLREKRAIAKTVATMIRDGDTLFINSGTTSWCVADALHMRKNLNVVTNSLAIATRLGLIPSFRVSLLGGDINARYGFTSGGNAHEQLGRYRADWAILSVEGISEKGGITTYHAEESVLDRMMMAGAGRVVVAADHSKLGKVGFARVCECSEHLHLVTDSHAPADQLDTLKAAGIHLVMAEMPD